MSLKQFNLSDDICRTILENIPISVIITDTQTRIIFANKRFFDITGYTSEEVINKPTNIFKSGLTSKKTYEDLWNTLGNKKPWTGQFINKKKSGEIYTEDVTIYPVQNNNSVVGYIAIKEDVSLKLSLQEEIFRTNTYDKMTNLLIRQQFIQKLISAIQKCKLNKTTYVIAMLDIDNFTVINDVLGNSCGDMILKDISQQLKAHLRSNDILSRTGGDEFSILFDDVDLDDIFNVCERIRTMIETQTFVFETHNIQISVSMGLCLIDSDTKGVSEIMSNCNLAVSAAKDNGKNKIEIYARDEQFLSRFKNMETSIKLKNWLKEDKFELFCQEIQPIKDSTCRHYEVLLRVINNNEIITPDKFLDIAETYKIMYDIDLWVIEKTFSFISSLSLDNECLFTINLSGQTINNSNFINKLSSLFNVYNVNPNNIGFEIVETSKILNIEDAKKLIDYLHSLGCIILIDDFGCGLSSFSRLKDLYFDMIKIDGTFVKNICSNTFDFAIVKGIVEIASVLGATTVAEYVHSEEVYEVVKFLGVDYVQGYHISKPLPICSSKCSTKKTCVFSENEELIQRLKVCPIKKFIDKQY